MAVIVETFLNVKVSHNISISIIDKKKDKSCHKSYDFT